MYVTQRQATLLKLYTTIQYRNLLKLLFCICNCYCHMQLKAEIQQSHTYAWYTHTYVHVLHLLRLPVCCLLS